MDGEKQKTGGKKMNNLVIQWKNNNVTSSLQVAESFGKRHDHVLRDIENLTTQNWGAKSLFFESTYESRGENIRCAQN